jgi:uncharacterized protein YuzE
MEKALARLEKVDLDYDEGADVLYLSFGKPREADDSVEVKEGVIYRIADNEIVGIATTNFTSKAETVKRFLKAH